MRLQRILYVCATHTECSKYGGTYYTTCQTRAKGGTHEETMLSKCGTYVKRCRLFRLLLPELGSRSLIGSHSHAMDKNCARADVAQIPKAKATARTSAASAFAASSPGSVPCETGMLQLLAECTESAVMAKLSAASEAGHSLQCH